MELVYISKFKNIEGVTCYMNSILHILQNIEHFFNFIFSKSISNKNIIHSSLNNLLKNSHNNEDISIIPMELRTNLGIKNSMWTEDIQQDSADFLNFLINELENELCLKASYIPTFKGNLNVMNQNLTYIDTFDSKSKHITYFSHLG
jgi:ubiquitin C-terminal hydrolase